MNLYPCTTCLKEKDAAEFNKCNFTKSGLQYKCRDCEKEYKTSHKIRIIENGREYYIKNRDLEKVKKHEYYLKNKEKINKRNKIWQKNNREKDNLRRAQHRAKNKHLYLEREREYRIKNYKKYRNYQNKWMRESRKKNPHYLVAHRLRNRLLSHLKNKNGTKGYSIDVLVGCSKLELVKHLESQFIEGMNWDRVFSGDIVIDHSRPCCSYNLTNKEQQKACFHYTNLRPLWKEDNSFKIKDDLKQSLILKQKRENLELANPT